MRLLLDTHTLIWWLAGDPSLSATAREAVADLANNVFVSVASAWEIATKYRIGKLPQAAALAADVGAAIARQGFTELPIAVLHGQAAGNLPGPHRDPFDRMLIAQARAEEMVIATQDPAFAAYQVDLLQRD